MRRKRKQYFGNQYIQICLNEVNKYDLSLAVAFRPRPPLIGWNSNPLFNIIVFSYSNDKT